MHALWNMWVYVTAVYLSCRKSTWWWRPGRNSILSAINTCMLHILYKMLSHSLTGMEALSSLHRLCLHPGTSLALSTGSLFLQWHSLLCSTPLLLSPSSSSFFPSYCKRILLLLTDLFLWFKVIDWELRWWKVGKIRVVGWLVSNSNSSLCVFSLTGSGGKLVLVALV